MVLQSSTLEDDEMTLIFISVKCCAYVGASPLVGAGTAMSLVPLSAELLNPFLLVYQLHASRGKEDLEIGLTSLIMGPLDFDADPQLIQIPLIYLAEDTAFIISRIQGFMEVAQFCNYFRSLYKGFSISVPIPLPPDLEACYDLVIQTKPPVAIQLYSSLHSGVSDDERKAQLNCKPVHPSKLSMPKCNRDAAEQGDFGECPTTTEQWLEDYKELMNSNKAYHMRIIGRAFQIPKVANTFNKMSLDTSCCRSKLVVQLFNGGESALRPMMKSFDSSFPDQESYAAAREKREYVYSFKGKKLRNSNKFSKFHRSNKHVEMIQMKHARAGDGMMDNMFAAKGWKKL
ncbi:hypothetical protein HAX54_045006 [Datura stramonium]|uniref:Uncharacterized protein n=1 Tax=Datura stramonium TaxID=4076 RepID=A0ABS8WJ39_DATST|nr:hypothetical protein [Datura stramonium]